MTGTGVAGPQRAGVFQWEAFQTAMVRKVTGMGGTRPGAAGRGEAGLRGIVGPGKMILPPGRMKSPPGKPILWSKRTKIPSWKTSPLSRRTKIPPRKTILWSGRTKISPGEMIPPPWKTKILSWRTILPSRKMEIPAGGMIPPSRKTAPPSRRTVPAPGRMIFPPGRMIFLEPPLRETGRRPALRGDSRILRPLLDVRWAWPAFQHGNASWRRE